MYLEAKRAGFGRGMNLKTERKRALSQQTRIQATAPEPRDAPQKSPAPAPASPPPVRRSSSTGLSDILGSSLSLGFTDLEPVRSRKRSKPAGRDLTVRQRQGKKYGPKGGPKTRPSQPRAVGAVMESVTVGGHTLRWRTTDRTNASGRGLQSHAPADLRSLWPRRRRSAEERAAELEPEQIAQHCSVLFGAGQADRLPEPLLGLIQEELRSGRRARQAPSLAAGAPLNARRCTVGQFDIGPLCGQTANAKASERLC